MNDEEDYWYVIDFTYRGFKKSFFGSRGVDLDEHGDSLAFPSRNELIDQMIEDLEQLRDV